MRWGQVAIALTIGLGAAGATLAQDHTLATAAAIALLAYIGVRWLLAWGFRTHYWYHNRGRSSRSCPSCGRYIYRTSGDWILTCHRCGWRAGWPGVRWLTRSVPVTQLRRTIIGPRLVVVILAVGLVLSGATGSVVDGPADEIQANGTVSQLNEALNETFTPPEEDISTRDVEQRVLELVNEERERSGLQTLAPNDRVRERARAHAEDMAAKDYFSHTAQDGVTAGERYAFCSRRGENIHQTWVGKRVRTEEGTKRHTTAADVAGGIYNGWMNSPPHHELIHTEWRSAGVGVTITDDGKVYAVMGFCESSGDR